MLQLFAHSGSKLHIWLAPARLRVFGIWLLLGLAVTSLLSSPVTQHAWAWDHFLRGGQDFETVSFLILVSCCLLVVLVHSCKGCVGRLFAALRALAMVWAGSAASLILRAETMYARGGDGMLPAFNVPLQI